MAALEAGAATLVLARIPSEGLSAARLGMLGLLALFAVVAGYLALRAPHLLDRLAHPRVIYSAAVLAVLSAAGLFLVRYADPAHLMPLYERLRPLLLYVLLVSAEGFIFLLALYRGLHPALVERRMHVLRAALLAFGLLLFVWLCIALTGLGITPDSAYWGEPGVPMQGWQFVLALLFGAAALHFLPGSSDRTRRLLIPVLIYAGAVLLWLSVPVEVLRNSFYVSLDPPYYDPYPYSDAGYYDTMAQSLLIGHPYQGEIPTRPLYIVLLAFLHAIFGQRYDLIIVGQTLVLAFIPILLYELGKSIHSPGAGVTAAVFFIFREWTTLLVSSQTRVSNTKTLLVDLPTLLLVLLACLLVMRWLERRESRAALIAGGSLGLLLLLRTQSLLLLPFVLLTAALVIGLRGKGLMRQAAWLVLGVAIAVTPWLLHNYLETARLALDASFQYKLLASQYAYTGNLDSRTFDFAGKGLGQILLQFLLRDPGFIFGFVASHFLAGWINGLLALPLFEPFPGLFEPLNLYWMSWNGHLAWYNAALLILYLAVISLGLASAWHRLRWVGLLPLVLNVGYSLATAIGRFSGWRYDLPADWVPYFYFAVGFAELLGLIAIFFGGQATETGPQPLDQAGEPRQLRHSVGWKTLLPAALVIALLGGLPWIAAVLAPPRYGDQSSALLTSKLARLPGSPAAAQIQTFLTQPTARLMEGRLLYPRYFSRGTGISSSHPWPSYAVRDFPRQGFLLLNGSLTDVVYPTPYLLDLPQGADAIILGCERGDYVEARLVALADPAGVFLSEATLAPCQ